MNKSTKEMITYYDRRASIYDQSMGYDRPEVMVRYENLLNILKSKFVGKNLLEIACGPGFWTRAFSSVTNLILATDYNDSVLNEAKRKNYHSPNVKFQTADAYDLKDIQDQFNACFAGDWWSHIPISSIPEFLAAIHSRLECGAIVAFTDQLRRAWAEKLYVRTDEEGNIYQERTLSDGSVYAVIKNFPTEQQLVNYIGDAGENFEFREDHQTGRWRFSYIKT